MPRSPGARPGVRRAGHAEPARARQGDHDRTRRSHDLPRTALAAHGRALPLARGRPRAARVPAGDRARGRRADGAASPRAARRGRAVPSRVGPHRAGPRAARQLPRRGLMPNAILTRAIDALASRRDLSAEQTAEVRAEIMHGEVSETQIAGFLIALRTKGETVEELAGLARTMRSLAAHVPGERMDLLDTSGTGGG